MTIMATAAANHDVPLQPPPITVIVTAPLHLNLIPTSQDKSKRSEADLSFATRQHAIAQILAEISKFKNRT